MLQTAEKENTHHIPITLTLHPHDHIVKSIILKTLITPKRVKQPPQMFLVRSSFQTNDQSGTFKCAHSQCKTCPFILNVEKMSGPKRSIYITNHFTCTFATVIYYITCIYCITCTNCNKLYIGETGRR